MLKSSLMLLAVIVSTAVMAGVPCKNCRVSEGNVIYRCEKGHIICTKCMRLMTKEQVEISKVASLFDGSSEGNLIGECCAVEDGERCKAGVRKKIHDNRSDDERRDSSRRERSYEERRDERRRRKAEEEARQEQFRREREEREEEQQREKDRLFKNRVKNWAQVQILCLKDADSKKFKVRLFKEFRKGNELSMRPAVGAVGFDRAWGYAPENLKTEETVVGSNMFGDVSQDVYGKNASQRLDFDFNIGTKGFSTTYYIPNPECKKNIFGLCINDHGYMYIVEAIELKPGMLTVWVSSTSRGVKVEAMFMDNDDSIYGNGEWNIARSDNGENYTIMSWGRFYRRQGKVAAEDELVDDPEDTFK